MRKLDHLLHPVKGFPGYAGNHKYGHSYAAAKYCNMERPFYIPGIWSHGWYSVEYGPFPYTDLQAGIKGNKLYLWNTDMIWHLEKNHIPSYRVIGAPYIYLASPNHATQKDNNNLLIVPTHGTSKANYEQDWDEYADYIYQFRQNFDKISVNLYFIEYAKPEIRNIFQKRGFDVITTGDIMDKNFLGKIKDLLDSHATVSSNSLGTMLIYALYAGCKISVSGPEIKNLVFLEKDLPADYWNNNEIELNSLFHKVKYKDFYIPPDKAVSNLSLGKHMLGYKYKLSPFEMKKEFMWFLPHRMYWNLRSKIALESRNNKK